MRIYRVRSDTSYASITCDSARDSTDIRRLAAEPIDNFISPAFSVACPRKPIGNFIHVDDTSLVFDEKAADVFGDFIEAAGQLLPLRIEGSGSWYLLNTLENCNPVDSSDSDDHTTDWELLLEPGRLAFRERRVASFSSLFKIPELRYLPVLTVTKGKDQEHDFFETYHEHELTGLIFDELWRSTSG